MINIDNAAANLATLGLTVDNDGLTVTAHGKGAVVVVASFEARVKIGRTRYTLEGIADAMPIAAALHASRKARDAAIVIAAVGAAVV